MADPAWAPLLPERFASLPRSRRPSLRLAITAARLATRGRSHHFVRAMATSPRTFWPFLTLNGRLMLRGTLGRRDTELVILRVAALCGSRYEWTQHVPLARRVGVTPEVIAAAGVPAMTSVVSPQPISPQDRMLLDAVDELVLTHTVSDPTWRALQERFPPRTLMELCMLVGNYAMLAGALNAFGVPLEAPWASAPGR
ncbi:MAG: carboxymuconolactone decarboxylase family protein [Patulibacter sp.]|nr:carboxymuconolactone decarboxylase family protein [Patulibacter sp.]